MHRLISLHAMLLNVLKQALETVAVRGGDRPVEDGDTRAIENAERHATGVAMPMKGGVGAAELN